MSKAGQTPVDAGKLLYPDLFLVRGDVWRYFKFLGAGQVDDSQRGSLVFVNEGYLEDGVRAGTLSVGMSGTGGPVLQSDHEVMNGLLDPSNLDGDQIGDGYFSILGLADLEGPWGFLVVKVKNLLVINLVEGDENLSVLPGLYCLHDHLEWTWEDASLLARKQVVNVLAVVLAHLPRAVPTHLTPLTWAVVPTHGTRVSIWRIVANDRISLPGPGLSVRKDGRIRPSKKLVDWLFQELEDFLLTGLVRQNMVELHVCEVTWALYLQSVIILQLYELTLLLLMEDWPDSDQYFELVLWHRPDIGLGRAFG